MDGTLVDTEPYWIDGRARARRPSTAARGPTSTRTRWSATTCSSPRGTSASTAAWRCEPEEIVDGCCDGVVAAAARARAVAARRARAARELRARAACRAPWSRCRTRGSPTPVLASSAGHVRRRRDRRRGDARQAAPRAVPAPRPGCSASTRPTAWRSRTRPTGVASAGRPGAGPRRAAHRAGAAGARPDVVVPTLRGGVAELTRALRVTSRSLRSRSTRCPAPRSVAS